MGENHQPIEIEGGIYLPPLFAARLTKREWEQLAHARMYTQCFAESGVPGHTQFVLLSKLYDILVEFEDIITNESD